MIILNLTFTSPLNASLQIGDIAYYAPTIISGGFTTANLGGVIAFGIVSAIINPLGLLTGPIIVQVHHDNTLGIPIPTMSDFIMFGKDKTVNSSSLIGYYADIAFVNNSDQKVELFSVGSEVSESSK
jgi:hypothetical protein